MTHPTRNDQRCIGRRCAEHRPVVVPVRHKGAPYVDEMAVLGACTGQRCVGRRYAVMHRHDQIPVHLNLGGPR